MELALITPVLLLFLFGISEFGLAWVSGNRLEGAVSTAARVGSVRGSSSDADQQILFSLQASLPDELQDNVTRIVIFRSNTNGTMPTGCASLGPGSSASGCNVYGPAHLASPPATALSGWPPSTRRDTLLGPPDYLGVLVETRHDDVTGTFWRDGFEMERTSVYRIQPDIQG
jgi:hypothetical protein